jgi:hypothetical protein
MPETTATQHNHGPNFGRHVNGCPRCGELDAGVPARDANTARNTNRPTAHTCNDGDGPHFGRKTPGCPRCDELLAGDPPRRPDWVATLGRRAEHDRQRAEDIRTHDCRRNDCGTICTAFEW